MAASRLQDIPSRPPTLSDQTLVIANTSGELLPHKFGASWIGLSPGP